MEPKDGSRDPGHPYPPEDVVLSAALLADEARRQGAQLRWVHRACFIAHLDERKVGFWCARTDLVSSVAEHLTRRKDLTHALLYTAGIPTIPTRSYAASELGAAHDEFTAGQDHTVKPAQGRQGRGVTVGVSTPRHLDVAWAAAMDADASWVLVQPTLAGREIRVLVIDGEVAAAAEKRPAVLVGVGRRTIAELVDAYNHERRGNPYLGLHPLVIDEAKAGRLQPNGEDAATVLPDGERRVLSRKASISDGGTSHDLTGAIHPALERLALAAVSCFPGLGIAGVDLIVADPAEPAGATVLEINSMPGLGLHHFPTSGEPRPVATRIVEATFAAARRRA